MWTGWLLLHSEIRGENHQYMRTSVYAGCVLLFNVPVGSIRARKAGVSQFVGYRGLRQMCVSLRIAPPGFQDDDIPLRLQFAHVSW